MWLLRGLGASLLWIVAGLVGLVGIVLSATLILLPVGIPLVMLARKIFGYSMVLLVPGKVRHPVASMEDSVHSGTKGLFKKSRKRSANPMNLGKKSKTKSLKKKAKKAKKALR
jgi:hypothetical protein